MAVPYGAIALAALGGFGVFRTFYRPHRAVLKDGFALRCPASIGCEPSVTVESYGGAVAMYAVAGGRVLRADNTGIEIALKYEPVVVRYEGGTNLQVRRGDTVGAGQQIGYAQRASFSVWQAQREGGNVRWIPIEPSSWLAARGMQLTARKRSGGATQWCEGGRRVSVPQKVGQCGIKLPTPGSFMLLPVSVSME